MKLPEDIKLHYVEVIDWTEKQDGLLAYHFPMQDREIPSGAQLTVRESQLALFLDEGKLADIFSPGRYMLTTKTLPLLTQIKKWDDHFRSPFKSDIFFFSTREQINQKWGTPAPITMRDVELGPIRVRAHGTYSFRIKNPRVFFEKICGTCEQYHVSQLDGQLRALIVSCLRGILGGSKVPFIDIASHQEALNEALKEQVKARFADYGLELATLTVQSVSLPKELQSHFDKVASMRMVGDVHKYFIFQAAESLTQTSKDPATGVGVGLGLGMAIAKLLQQAGQSTGGAPASGAEGTRLPIPSGNDPAGSGRDAGTPTDTFATTLAQLRELQKKGVLSDEEVEQKIAALFRKK